MSETTTPTVKEPLARSFDKSATAVRAYVDQFEKDYGRPALHSATTYFEAYPLTSTFVAIFGAFSFIPVATFLVLSLFVVLSISFLAFSCAFILSSAIVLFFLSILVLSLCTAFFFAGCISLILLSTYVGFRLFTLIRSDGRDGISTWAVETKSRFVYPQPNRGVAREASDGSAVVVESEPDADPDVKPPPEAADSDNTVKQEGYD
ncbi:hypothetical protein C8F01DRAFT_1261582 [Mycena amicta]|nr:hypothetical protein C8F01DRAFT_1261582 [Mycena amicta]